MPESDQMRVLIVDDEEHICRIISMMLEQEGYACDIARDAETALEKLRSDAYQLCICDIMMPGMSGVELLEAIQSMVPNPAVIMVTAVDNRDMATKTLQLGAYGYVIKPFDRNEILITVANALERRRLALLSRQYENELEAEVRERTQDVRNREEEVVLRLISALGYRDTETGAHARRLGLMAATVAERMGWDAESRGHIRLAAPMHDVGKIGVPDSILRKPGKLTEEEFEIIKQHTAIGADILSGSQIPLLQMGKDIALHHHEKWDGTGYLGGLSGEEIPGSARIAAIADVYDALVHDRVYRPALPEEDALTIIRAERGKHFDPNVLDCFLDVASEVRRIRAEIPDDRRDAVMAGSGERAEGGALP